MRLLQAGFQRYRKALASSTLCWRAVPPTLLRWYAIKLYEQDEKVLPSFRFQKLRYPRSNEFIDRAESSMLIARKATSPMNCTTISQENRPLSCTQSRNGTKPTGDKIEPCRYQPLAGSPFFSFDVGKCMMSASKYRDLPSDGWSGFSTNLIGSNYLQMLQMIGTSAWLTGQVVEGIIAGWVQSSLSSSVMIFFFFLALKGIAEHQGGVHHGPHFPQVRTEWKSFIPSDWNRMPRPCDHGKPDQREPADGA